MKMPVIVACTSALLIVVTAVGHAQQSGMKDAASSQADSFAVASPALARMISDSLVLPLVGSADHLDGRLAFLKTELKITVAQQPLWDAFAAAVRANARRKNQLQAAVNAAVGNSYVAPTLPQQLQADERQLQVHMQMLQRVSAALLPLYSSFSERQRGMAEALATGPIGL